MTHETILTNARLVLPERVLHGTLLLRDAKIAAIDDGPSAASGAIDCEGDTLIPGIVDLHTDNLERQVQPRASARWPSRSALVAHDAQCAVAGVTTVFDALCLGDLGFDRERVRTFHEGMADLAALDGTGLLRSAHYLHLRCELPAPDMLDLVRGAIDDPRVRMLSMMDHSPGVGQYADIGYWRRLRARDGLNEAELDRKIAHLQDQRARLREPNRRALLGMVAGRPIVLASHDDETEADIAANRADGIVISEFPVTMIAAKAARAAGMHVIAGAPNIVRGGSHSGNVKVADLIAAEAVDALASDYVPASLVEAAFLCAASGMRDLPGAVGMITDMPARMAGLADRGRIATGLCADLVRVADHAGLAVVRATWRGGARVA